MQQDVYVNHKLIPEDMIGQEMQYHPAQSKQEAWQKAAEALVLRELLLQEAFKEHLTDVDNDEAEIIDALLAKKIDIQEPSQEECLAFYQAQKHRLLDSAGQIIPYSQLELLIKTELAARTGRLAVKDYLQTLVEQSQIQGLVIGQTWLPVRMMN
ncbi:MAG TPA: hypothetical protein PKL69_03640 [Agitococcus sp.]|uniref:hypothetical protein n=1 Tax=uncultured Agitococcus sp. TaxID=1506599 RepID=UPI00260DC09E|nr:hypothetical protein [uncultured Agitococcus sp.]HMU87761.1 hypothetical protein [Agitococcus sp.]HMV60497.1 hypothetical protein [Agitococcus sp.]HMX98326.1 hypothetical protein [Agitococcus sp.]HMY28186.1 hypothetical protein [Agitococcus sp.]HMY81389.1 hypothetical protein [Agitococcus sp.]